MEFVPKIIQTHMKHMTGKFEYYFNRILDSYVPHHMTHLTLILNKIKKLDKPFYITTPIGISTLVENIYGECEFIKFPYVKRCVIGS